MDKNDWDRKGARAHNIYIYIYVYRSAAFKLASHTSLYVSSVPACFAYFMAAAFQLASHTSLYVSSVQACFAYFMAAVFQHASHTSLYVSSVPACFAYFMAAAFQLASHTSLYVSSVQACFAYFMAAAFQLALLHFLAAAFDAYACLHCTPTCIRHVHESAAMHIIACFGPLRDETFEIRTAYSARPACIITLRARLPPHPPSCCSNPICMHIAIHCRTACARAFAFVAQGLLFFARHGCFIEQWRSTWVQEATPGERLSPTFGQTV